MTDKLTPELLPCPFCGGEPECDMVPFPLDEDGDPSPNAGGHFIQCSKCEASTALVFPLKDDVSRELTERWNRRAAQSAQPAADWTYCTSRGYEIGERCENAADCARNGCALGRAQPAAVGAKLTTSQREQISMDAISYADAVTGGDDGEADNQFSALIAYVESLLASARAAGMEEAAKIFDEMADQAENDSYHFLCRSKAAAIRAAIGATDGTEPR